MTPARIDLHCHTLHSVDHWRVALPQGAELSIPFYPSLAPCAAYDLALSRGMTHVTFTDHDTLAGCLEVLATHPRPAHLVMGEEVSCYDGGECLHVGVYGLSVEDHEAIHAGSERTDRERSCLRWQLEELLAYCEERELAYDLKHPLWSLRAEGPPPTLLRRWLGLFARVEAINGTRHPRLNTLGQTLAERLGPRGVAFTGGSDSHTSRIGQAWTATEGATPAEIVASLRAGRCSAGGSHGSHHELDADTRTCLVSNITGRAGHFSALAQDYMHKMPLVAQDLGDWLVSAGVLWAVLNEYRRQRALARAAETAFAAELAAGELVDAGA